MSNKFHLYMTLWTLITILSAIAILIYGLILFDAIRFERSEMIFLGREHLYKKHSSKALILLLIIYLIGMIITIALTYWATYEFLK